MAVMVVVKRGSTFSIVPASQAAIKISIAGKYAEVKIIV